jgi:hypothetical protein
MLLSESQSLLVKLSTELSRRVSHALLGVGDDLARPGLIHRLGYLLQQRLQVRAQRGLQVLARHLAFHALLLVP